MSPALVLYRSSPGWKNGAKRFPVISQRRTRATLDIDYVGHDLRKNALQHTIEQVAQEVQLDVEAVPIDEFVPMPGMQMRAASHLVSLTS